MNDEASYNKDRCYLGASRTVPGLCGVFAARKFPFDAPNKSLGPAPSRSVADYSGVLMLESKFDAFQAMYHHDMGVGLPLLARTEGPPSKTPVERLVVAGSPLCYAAQINRPVEGHPSAFKPNCSLTLSFLH
jgi:hypothetical protein